MKAIKEIGTHGVTIGEDPEAVYISYVDLSLILTELANVSETLAEDRLSQFHIKSTFVEAGRILLKIKK